MSDEKKGRFHQRLWDPVLALLKQGLTPEEVALALAVGAGLGVCPVPGVTTAPCVLARLALRRFNPVALQVANYAVWPLQLLLLFPFFRMGLRCSATKCPYARWRKCCTGLMNWVSGRPSVPYGGLSGGPSCCGRWRRCRWWPPCFWHYVR